MELLTKDNGSSRELTCTAPAFFDAKDLVELTEMLAAAGVKDAPEEIIFKKAMDQLVIDFRAFVRGKLAAVVQEEGSETTSEKFPDDSIIAMANEWLPSLRKQADPVAKAAKAFGGMSPEQIKAALAQAGIELGGL